MLRLVSVILFFSCLATASQAAPPAIKVLGFDDMTCVAWVNTKADIDLRQPYLDWARGFLTGHNYAQPGAQTSIMSDGTIASYIDRHCRENSKSAIDIALMRMSDQYSGRNAPITK